MPGRYIGSTIAAAFGLIYVIVNTTSLPAVAAWTLRAAGMTAAAVVAVVVFHGVRKRTGGAVANGLGERAGEAVTAGAGTGPSRAPFGRTYWLIVVIEFAAIFVGSRLLSSPLDHPSAGVAWVSLVVGVHFFALATHFRMRFFHGIAAGISACGVAGLVIAFAGPGSSVGSGMGVVGGVSGVAVVGGVIPGMILLGVALWGLDRHPYRDPIRERARPAPVAVGLGPTRCR